MRNEIPADFSHFMEAFNEASLIILLDRSVWRAELESSEERILQWPRPVTGSSYQQFLASLFNLQALAATGRVMLEVATLGATIDVIEPEALQVALRVAQRATDAGVVAARKKVGWGRLTGRREYLNRVRKHLADEAVRLRGISRDDAFTLLGLSRAGAYRALRRKKLRRT